MSIVRKIETEIDEVIAHAENVCSIFFRSHDRFPNFRPGQFLHLALEPYDPSRQWPESRVFSIANSPTRASRTRITFAAKGPFTRRMIEQARVGRKVWLKLPYGSFTFENSGRPKILIAGGTGITPFVSYLEYAVDTRAVTPISLYYGVRSPDLIIFDCLLKECKEKMPAFSLTLFLEQGSYGSEVHKTGRLDIKEIGAGDPTAQASDFYLSGPLVMVRSFRSHLIERSVNESNILVDDWG